MKHMSMKFVLATVAFVLVLLGSNWLLSGARLDLTEQKIYSLSDGTVNIVKNLQQDIELTLFFSDKNSQDLTALRSYAQRVKELLTEYVLLSNNRLTLKLVDPEPFSEAEDLAAEMGLQSVPISNGQSIYFGLSAKNAQGDDAVLTFIQPDKEAFLEYEISELIYRLSQSSTQVVGLMSSLPIRGGFDMQAGGNTPPWAIYEQLDQLYDVRWVDEQLTDLDKDMKLLILVQPTQLDEESLYELDQFVMKGGKLIVFVDPKAETKQASPMDLADDEALGTNSLQRLFDQWQLAYHTDEIVVDNRYGLTISMGQGMPPVRHLGLLGVQADGLNPNEIATSELEVINFASAGRLKSTNSDSESGVQFEALVWSSNDSQTINSNEYNLIQDPASLLRDFVAADDSFVMAARLSGAAQSAFTSKPQGSDYQGDHEGSIDNLNVMVIADTDLLTDRLWVQVQNFFGQRIVQPWADNGAFVNNLVEQYLGSTDLINIRSRGRFTRPFEVVQDIQQQAESVYLANEKALQQQLQETEQQLALLEQQRDKDTLTLSPAQELALDNFQHEKLRIRKALRDVQHELDKDIEQLGSSLKLVNIAVMPLLLTLLLWLLVRIKLRKP